MGTNPYSDKANLIPPAAAPEELQSEIARREGALFAKSFRAYTEAAWPIIEPGTRFLPGYHIDAICDHLQACATRQIKRLLITIAPRHSKSSLVSVLYPSWLWTFAPTERSLFASYSLALATRDSVRTRRVIESDWYRKRWPHVELVDDQNLKASFENTLTGNRHSTAVGAATTGLGGSQLVVDDPIAVQEAESAAVRESTLTWFREAWSTRANTHDTCRIVVMQRVHQRDVVGYCLEEGGWEHLNLPFEFEGDRRKTIIGWSDPRTKQGDVLWPARYSDPDEVASMKKTMGPAGVAGQLQQRPVPRGGAIFKKEWFRFWYPDDGPVPPPVVAQKEGGDYVECVQKALPPVSEIGQLASWDLAFKGGAKNDYVVGQVWTNARRAPADKYLLAQERGQWDFVQTLAAIRRMQAQYPTTQTLVEDKANGSAVIASIRSEIPGMIAINPQGGKESRASAIAPLLEAGNVYFPHPAIFPWVDQFLDELLTFPRGNHDDQVDAMTQALSRSFTTHIEMLDIGEPHDLWRSNPWEI